MNSSSNLLTAPLKDQIAALEPLVVGKPYAMFTLARMMHQDRQRNKAFDLCNAALRLAPDDRKLAATINAFVNETVPDWHIPMIRDNARNAAYDAALRRAVTPNSRVLEIGCGSGLLAMMAARAGAREVVTCEMIPAVASKAAEIVARNGYGDRVRVIAKHSSMLDAETDLGGRADILVSEIVDSVLLGEAVLPAHEHAVRDLLKPGARVIPARGTVRVALAHDGRQPHDLTNIAGFDLSAFRSLAMPLRRYTVGDERLALRSDAADLFSFDFASPRYCPPAEASLDCVSTGGAINGVAQWIALTLDEVTHYENRPRRGAYSAWGVMFHSFAQEFDTAPGEKIKVYGAHDREHLTIWAEKR
jgi:predicted nicotinamide N-methyase